MRERRISRRKINDERLLEACVCATRQGTSAAAALGGASSSVAPSDTAACCPAVHEPVDPQASLITSAGVTFTPFNKVRFGFGGARGPTASISDLSAARMRLAGEDAKRVILKSTWAHHGSLRLAIREALSHYAASDAFIDRSVYLSDGTFCAKKV